MPNASFIGFTGTPIKKTDANTRAVFGDYISIYDLQRAGAGKVTEAIYYEIPFSQRGQSEPLRITHGTWRMRKKRRGSSVNEVRHS